MYVAIKCNTYYISCSIYSTVNTQKLDCTVCIMMSPIALRPPLYSHASEDSLSAVLADVRVEGGVAPLELLLLLLRLRLRLRSLEGDGVRGEGVSGGVGGVAGNGGVIGYVRKNMAAWPGHVCKL